jgi:hypothetical protein
LANVICANPPYGVSPGYAIFGAPRDWTPHRSSAASPSGRSRIGAGSATAATSSVLVELQLLPYALDLHIGLVQSPTATHWTLARAEFVLKLRDIFEHSPIQHGVINARTAFGSVTKSVFCRHNAII